MTQSRISSLAATAEVDAMTALLAGGWIDIYDGTQPATADTVPTANEHVLASLRFGTPAFGPGTNGIATAFAIAADQDAARTGTATWYRLTQADHTTVVADGSIGTSAADMILNATAIQQHAEFSIASFTLTANKA